jgi:hypothetical protein
MAMNSGSEPTLGSWRAACCHSCAKMSRVSVSASASLAHDRRAIDQTSEP